MILVVERVMGGEPVVLYGPGCSNSSADEPTENNLASLGNDHHIYVPNAALAN